MDKFRPARHRPTLLRLLFFSFAIGLFTACSVAPERKSDQLADAAGFVKTQYQTTQHTLIAYQRLPSPAPASIPRLHVYLEGDGRPWKNGREPARNPTSRSPLALKLAISDPHPSVYLNRPCYGFAQMPASCQPEMWTAARYSADILASLDQALDSLKQRYNIDEFVLMGYSGGGNLAALLAHRRRDISHLITIAGNLDHVAWTQYFAYDPLGDSLKASDYFPLPGQIKRLHLIGQRDHTVPPATNLPAAQKDQGAEIIILPNFDHRCCWQEYWPSVLNKLQN